MIEKWKAVPRYEGIYEVSDCGRVRRVLRASGTSLKILKPFLSTSGYPLVALSRKSHIRKRAVHVLVMRAFIGDPPCGQQINHKNGQRTDARLTNLEYVTASENNLHMYRVLGRKQIGPLGERAGAAKLTSADVVEIRRRCSQGDTMKSLGEDFGVTLQAIWLIVHRKNWKHVQ